MYHTYLYNSIALSSGKTTTRTKTLNHGNGLKVALPSKYWTSSLAPARCLDDVVHPLCNQKL